MLKRKHVILAGAVAAAGLPVFANAATVTFSFDFNDLLVASAAAGPYTLASSTPGVTLTGTASAPVLKVPVGEFIEYGLDATVTPDPTAGGFSTATGLASYGLGIADSNAAVATVNPSPTVINGFFTSVQSAGTSDGVGGVNSALGTTGSYISGGNSTTAKSTYGVGGPAELYNSQRIKPLTAGQATFTVTDNAGGLGFIQHLTNTGSGAPVYTNRPYTAATDTVSALPVLSVTYGSVTTTAQPIISLTSGAPTTYGSQLGTAIHITGSNGAYTVGNTGQVADPGQTTAYTAVSTFSPAADKEVYALKLDKSGTAIATSNTTLLNAIVTDINSTSTTNPGNTGNVVASLVTGVYTSLFPGYDILLTAATGPGATPYLGVDFSNDTTDAGVTVTEIAAVPEPATAAGVVLGAAGLLLGRRKNRLTVA